MWWEDRGEVEEGPRGLERTSVRGATGTGENQCSRCCFGQWSYDCSRAETLTTEKASETKGMRAEAEAEAENHHFPVVEMMVAEMEARPRLWQQTTSRAAADKAWRSRQFSQTPPYCGTLRLVAPYDRCMNVFYVPYG